MYLSDPALEHAGVALRAVGERHPHCLRDLRGRLDRRGLFSDLCKLSHLDPQADGVVLCHSEGYARGIASNHADVLHWWRKFGVSMDNFRRDVAEKMKGGERDLTEQEVRSIVREELAAAQAERDKLPPSDWAKAGLEQAKAAGITDGSRPQSWATRQEVALMVQKRFLEVR